eukprot:CAMPEP_0202904288 /NCGR_PEP_ID=MMETSP1392-20130828/28672_1 /ASSEMBLY_ACC=CAM_ASM_000868 /TAXON_ID=225041 /ORGANISM="Chlamydomonas chlamydogama, Strain SAG 11-48b" /LENGTH=191 /DNA_ID=CAMNT_0049591843 /DNA_START=44 /DNA_END=615 /DNA_ORIENTATION=-
MCELSAHATIILLLIFCSVSADARPSVLVNDDSYAAASTEVEQGGFADSQAPESHAVDPRGLTHVGISITGAERGSPVHDDDVASTRHQDSRLEPEAVSIRASGTVTSDRHDTKNTPDFKINAVGRQESPHPRLLTHETHTSHFHEQDVQAAALQRTLLQKGGSQASDTQQPVPNTAGLPPSASSTPPRSP